MADRARRLAPLAAPFLLYACLSVALIGRPVIGHLGSTAMGTGGDPSAFTWFLKWWPELLRHGWDPLHSNLVWSPEGFNMTWTPTMPAAGVLMAPLTEAAGPLVSYNVLLLLCPALGGWSAFLLCRAAGADYLPSVAGGYLFGFSSYMMGHTAAHPNLSLVAPAPLAAYLVLRRVQGRIGSRWFVAGLTAVLAFEFLTSTEVFLTFTLIGLASLGIAALLYRDLRPTLRQVLVLVVIAYAITGLLVSPFIYASFSDPDRLTTLDPFIQTLDPLSIVIPNELNAVGGAAFGSVSRRFAAGPGELGGYLGPVLAAILVAFVWQQRRRRRTMLLLAVFLLTVLLAMGPRLSLLGHITAVRLPWSLFVHLPITKLVLPVRMILFAWIPVAVAIALWLSGRRSRWRWAAVVLAAVTLLPNTSYTVPAQPYEQPGAQVPFWHSPRPVPKYFSDGQAERELGGGRRVLIVPYGWAYDSEDMLWQAAAGMSFEMPEAYLGATIPPEFLCWHVVEDMLGARYVTEDRRELLGFLAAKDIDAVVVGDDFAAAARPLVSVLGRPRVREGVHVYAVPSRSATRAERCRPRS